MTNNLVDNINSFKPPLVLETKKGNSVVIFHDGGKPQVILTGRDGIIENYQKLFDSKSNSITRSNFEVAVNNLIERTNKQDIIPLEKWLSTLSKEEIEEYNKQCDEISSLIENK